MQSAIKSVLTEPAIENQLLSGLPKQDYESILPSLQLADFSLGETIYEPGQHLEYVFFQLVPLFLFSTL
jgi:hypothetical protein